MIFAEAVTELAQYTAIPNRTGVPILANITEFGCTPLFTWKNSRRRRLTSSSIRCLPSAP